MVKQLQNYLNTWNQKKNSKETNVLVHCWRGGKRSESVAWMLNLFGYHAITLDKGYKAFRLHHIIQII